MRSKKERNIYWDKTSGKYKVQFGVHWKNKTIGSYHTKEEAIAARDQWVKANGWRRNGPQME